MEQILYKAVGDVELLLDCFKPRGWQASDRRPAIVFFFGGGWSGGTTAQFHPHCEHLAAAGMVACVADYRVKSRHGTTPFECVMDGKSAVRYMRDHASDLGVDPSRIAAGGGSAGGHVAAAAGLCSGGDEAGEVLTVSSRPDALVLFNPVFDNGPEGYGHAVLGDRWQQLSPLHNICSGAPPAIVFLGTEDSLIPVATGEAFQDAMQATGSRCELHLYDGQPHGFFNYREGANPYYRETVAAMDDFLCSLGWC